MIGLAVERRMLDGPWGGFIWRPAAVFPVPPDVAPWTPLGIFGQATRYYGGRVEMQLFSTYTSNYADNLATGAPKLWVVLRADGPEPPIEIVAVTADPAEGEAHTEAGNNIVDTIAMPVEIAALLAEFTETHHVERAMQKRKRHKWTESGPGSGSLGTTGRDGGGDGGSSPSGGGT
ncbi:MAG: DUF3305 domain-containing protein [Hyphomicrobiaceae bacterium]